MERVSTLVIGGGLAGLHAAWRLQQAGVHDVRVLEARPRLGGRIMTLPVSAGGIDLGATWYWPALQPQVQPLLATLGLTDFADDPSGDLLYERDAGLPPARVPACTSEPPARRLRGGMGALVAALAARLPAGTVRTGCEVVALHRTADGVAAEVRGPDSGPRLQHAQRVLLALPPRLALHALQFSPALPAGLADAWAAAPTHMAPHAKYVASYDRAFWQPQGLSGAARSRHGPLGEIHDASAPGMAALFGFVLLPAAQRHRLPHDALLAQCRAQLVRLFGPQAATPRHEACVDWSAEPFTATPQCASGLAPPPVQPLPIAPLQGPWTGRLIGAGSEWAALHPGYVAGALEASTRAARRVVDSMRQGDHAVAQGTDGEDA